MSVQNGQRGGWSDCGAAYLRQLDEYLRLARLAQRLSQEQLARASGLSRNAISTIERGTHCTDLLRLARLATALDLPTSRPRR
jgi:transcriptional regulator with XRE-family HTH domain